LVLRRPPVTLDCAVLVTSRPDDVFFFFLTVEDFGLITGSIVLVQVGLTAGTLGADFTVLRLFYKWSEAERRRVVAGITGICVVWSIGLAIGLHAVLSALRLSMPVYWTLSFGWWAGLLLGVRGVPLSIVRVTGAVRSYGLFVLGGAVAQFVLQLAFVIAKFGPAGYMLGYAVGILLSTLLALYAVRRDYAWSPQAWRLPRNAIDFTIRVLPSVLFSRLVAVSDRTLLAWWGTQSSLGLYGAASRFTTPLKFLSGGFKMALVPALSREEQSGRADAIFRRMSQFLVVGMMFTGTLVALAVWFIRFTPWAAASDDLQRVVGLLLLAQFLSGLIFLGQVHFYYSPRPGLASVVSGLNAVVLLAGLAFLVPRAGADGAALAALVAGAVGFGGVLLVALWLRGRMEPWLRLSALLLTFIPCVVASWWFGRELQLVVFGISFAMYAFSLAVVMRGFRGAGVQEFFTR
jgi:O-antigen/teichoic acid export membrane protein